MKEMMKWIANEEEGQGMVEYALILALISIVAIVALTNVGEAVDGIFGEANEALGGAAE
ncbi:MAG: Flp family type IVb pilin [Oscillospiraceae bacterium]|nr:Flp family type IVb pilin [Oscillospiraceae bacterium]